MIVDRDVYGWPEPRDTGLFGIKIKLPKIKIGKALGGIAKGIGKGIGTATKVIAKVDPVTGTIRRVASGQRIDRAIGGAVAEQRALAKTMAPVLRVAGTAASFVPGVGTGVSAGLQSAAAWGSGQSIPEALRTGASRALPGGEYTQRALALGSRLAKGERVDRALLAEGVRAASDYGGPVVSAAARAGMAVAQGQNVVQVARGQINPIAQQIQGQTMNFLTSRMGSLAPRSLRRPLISSAAPSLPSPFGQRGTLALAAMQANPALAALGNDALSRRLHLPISTVSAMRQGVRGLRWRGLSTRAAQMVSGRSFAPLRVLSRDTGGLAPDGRSYTVDKGDTGSKIAKKLVGDANRWPELKAANPKIAARKDPPAGYTQKFGMVLWGGEVLALPDSWIQGTRAAPAAPTAEENTASVIQAQGILATWGKTDGSGQAGLTDYGSQAEDINGSWDARDKLMLAAFANWRGKGLSTDGHLTDAHLIELRGWAEEKARQVIPIPLPSPLPSVPTAPAEPPVSAAPPVSTPPDFTIPTIPSVPVPVAEPSPMLPPVPALPALPTPVAAAPPTARFPDVPALPAPVAAAPPPPPTGAPGAAKKDGAGVFAAAGLGLAYALGWL